MTKLLLTLVLSLTSALLFSQSLLLEYEGVLIQKDGTRITCVLKGDTHYNLMHELSYRLEGEEEFKLAYPKDLQAFEIPEQNLRFVSLPVQDWKEGPYKNLVPIQVQKFLKQIESGPISLYEYRSPIQKKNILFIKKGDEPLKRLEVLKVTTTFEGTKEVDTLFSTSGLKDRSDKYKVQKIYLPLLARATNDCPNLQVGQQVLLKKASIRQLVQDYNQCTPDPEEVPHSFATKEQRLRLHLFSNFFFKEDNSNLIPQPGLELEAMLNANQNSSISLGITKTPVQYSTPGVATYRQFGEVDPTEGLLIVYLKAKLYFVPSSRLKPHLYYRFDTFSGAKVGPLIAANSIGAGLTYLAGKNGFFNLGVNVIGRFDLQIGYGRSF